MDKTTRPALLDASSGGWGRLGLLGQAAVVVDAAYIVAAETLLLLLLQHGDSGSWAVILLLVTPPSCIAPLVSVLALWVVRNLWTGILAVAVNVAWLCMPAFFPDGISFGFWVLTIRWASGLYYVLALPSVLTLAALPAMFLRHLRAPTPLDIAARPSGRRRFLLATKRLAITLAALGAAGITGAAILSPTECMDTLEARILIQNRLPPEQVSTLKPVETLSDPRNCTHSFIFSRRGETVSVDFLPDFIHGTKFYTDEETLELLHRRR